MVEIEHPKVQSVEIGTEDAGQRLDNFLLRTLKGVPKSRIYRIVRKGEVRVNKKRAKVDYRIEVGDQVRIPPVRIAQRQEPSILHHDHFPELEVIAETDGWCAVNKPAGLAVHGGSGVNLGLIERFRLQRPECKRLELVHRLDRGTSGVLLIAKKRSELVHLQSLFRNKTAIDKRYIAFVKGAWPKHLCDLRCPLKRSEERADGRFVRVSEQGKDAQTRFGLIDASSKISVIQASPITGRTHQIRVHARHLGHPLAGDDKYGDDEFNAQLRKSGLKRLALHAAALSFVDQNALPHRLIAPLPHDLVRFSQAMHLNVENLTPSLTALL